MEWLELLLQMALTAIVLVTIVFALIGINKVYKEYKESKWEKKYGNKLNEDTERAQWENEERLNDRVFLLEEIIKEHGIENSIDKIKRIISEVDYDARYGTWKKIDSKWRVFALSSMSGGFGSSKKAQNKVNEDFGKYEEQRKQELIKKLKKAIEKAGEKK